MAIRLNVLNCHENAMKKHFNSSKTGIFFKQNFLVFGVKYDWACSW